MAEGKPLFSSATLAVGFYGGVLLSFACFAASASYLFQFQLSANAVISDSLAAATSGGSDTARIGLAEFSLGAHLIIARILLLSCGIFAGLAFGFLGFSLFLIGVQGNIDAEASDGANATIKLARISPGALVMIVAAILIGICATSTVGGSLGVSETAPGSIGDVLENESGTANDGVDLDDADRFGEEDDV